MASSSADCVFGDARLISSTRRTFANTGPGLNSNSFVRWLKTLTPVTSVGRRSGVNCRRENERCSERASDFASTVFPTPGKSSMIRWPSARRHRTQSSSVSARCANGELEVRDDALDDVRCCRGRDCRSRRRARRRSSVVESSRSTSSSTAAAISRFGAFSTRRSPFAESTYLVVGDVEADVRPG